MGGGQSYPEAEPTDEVAKEAPLEKTEVTSTGTGTTDVGGEAHIVAENPVKKKEHFFEHSYEYNAFAINATEKLSSMTGDQKLFAEKIIYEALFKGMMKELSPKSEVYTPAAPYFTSQPFKYLIFGILTSIILWYIILVYNLPQI